MNKFSTHNKTQHFFFGETAIIVYFVVIKIVLHILLPEYGFFRDEYYYLDISEKFSFSNLDMLPLTPLYLKLITMLLGTSIKAVHFASALCGALALAVSILITRELGGRKYAQFLTGLFVLFSGFLIFGALFTYDSLDFLIWTTVIFLLVKIFQTNRQRLWIPIGFILGLGLLNKLTILFLGFAIFVSLWLVPQRRYFKKKWIWISGGTAFLFFLPFVIWQSTQNWYFLEFAAGYAGGIAYITSFPEFIWQQLLPNNLFNFPVWIAGLYVLLFSRNWKTYRFFGICYIVLFFLLFIFGAKFYFLIPFYTILIAVGTISVENLFQKLDTAKIRTRLIQTFLPVIYIVLSLPLLPMVVPVLPIEQFVIYARYLGIDAGVRTENLQISELPQHIADRFGWEELAKEVSGIFHELPEAEKALTGILTTNWGQASALNYYRNQYRIPSATTFHGWYYFETLRTNNFKPMVISIGYSRSSLQNMFLEVELKSVFTHPYCIPHENNKPIYICRRPRFNIRQFWLVQNRIDPKFLNILNTKGVSSAVAYFSSTREQDPSNILFSERQMNSIGYEYLYKRKIAEAIQLFQLNVNMYPQAFNVYDSLAEAYMLNKQYELAILNYKKSLELNPDNMNAEKKLAEIKNLFSPSDQKQTNQ